MPIDKTRLSRLLDELEAMECCEPQLSQGSVSTEDVGQLAKQLARLRDDAQRKALKKLLALRETDKDNPLFLPAGLFGLAGIGRKELAYSQTLAWFSGSC